MAITVREEQDLRMFGTANATFTTGAGLLTTDKLVLIHANDFYAASNLTTPTGTAGSSWSLALTVDNGTNAGHTKVWTSDVAAAGAQTVILNSTTTDEERYAALFVLTGAVSGVDGSASTANGASSTSIVAPSVTPTSGQADDLLICFFGAGIQGGTGAVDLTMPGGAMTAYTERDTNWTANVGSEPLTSAGATGTRTATASVATSYQTLSILIRSDVTPLQPTYVSDRGSAANATAGTSTTVTVTSPTSITVGNYLIARVAVDNSGTSGAAPGCTVTDSRNTWTVLGPALSDPGAVAAGATAYLCYAKVATAYQAADTLTFNWGGISTTAKAIVVEEWSKIAAVTPVAVTAVTNNSVAAASTTAVTATIVPTAASQLVYCCLADEGIAGDSITYDSDTTNGSWSTALTRLASADATATNNQCVAGQYKIVSAGGSQTWNATITSRDWAAIAVVFSPPVSPRLDPRIRRLLPLLVR